MKHPFLRFVRLVVPATVVAGLIAIAACTNTITAGPPTGPGVCDPTQCTTGNTCIVDAMGVSACRIACMAQTDCPFNTQCATSAPQNFCVKLNTAIAQKPTGQWGTHCLPSDGLENNKACDIENVFGCYGTGTTDANAYCTQFDCMADLDCAGGYYCATVNKQPNVKSDDRTFGKTRNVCKKRDYCAPCTGDVDCPIIDGKQSRCATDDKGVKYCATPCVASANCRLDSSCTGVADDGTKLCRPRAGVCKGDGSICSPCLSDADCPMGFCLKGTYSPEQFCSVKAGKACAPGVKGDCPAFTGVTTTKIGCESSTSDANIPKDQCIGLVPFGPCSADADCCPAGMPACGAHCETSVGLCAQGDVGCYTKH